MLTLSSGGRTDAAGFGPKLSCVPDGGRPEEQSSGRHLTKQATPRCNKCCCVTVEVHQIEQRVHRCKLAEGHLHGGILLTRDLIPPHLADTPSPPMLKRLLNREGDAAECDRAQHRESTETHGVEPQSTETRPPSIAPSSHLNICCSSPRGKYGLPSDSMALIICALQHCVQISQDPHAPAGAQPATTKRPRLAIGETVILLTLPLYHC